MDLSNTEWAIFASILLCFIAMVVLSVWLISKNDTLSRYARRLNQAIDELVASNDALMAFEKDLLKVFDEQTKELAIMQGKNDALTSTEDVLRQDLLDQREMNRQLKSELKKRENGAWRR